MKTRISTLHDGEIEDHEIEHALRALRRDGELRRQWCDCQLIGDALRGERRLGIDVTARVMAAIEQEPTVLVPAPRRLTGWQRPALALAASAAGVALVAWLAVVPGSEGAPTAAPALAAGGQAPVVATSPSTPRLQEYLVAHQAYAPAGAMVGGARNIRTVAAPGGGR